MPTFQRGNATAPPSAGSDAPTALHVATKVNSLKRLHQSGQGGAKKAIEREAWAEINTLTQEQIAVAEGKAVSLLLGSWAYFARFWERGKDGPLESSVPTTP